MQKELLNLLAARKGHFRLESGHHGDLWLDLDLLFVRPGQVRRFAIELADRLSKHNVAAVCGPLVGGALVAQTVASELDVEFYYAERFVLPERDALVPVEYRIPNGLRKMVHGKDIAIVDDVINAGSAARGTLAELRSCGARPVVVGALLVLGSAAPGFFAGQRASRTFRVVCGCHRNARCVPPKRRWKKSQQAAVYFLRKTLRADVRRSEYGESQFGTV